MSKARNRSRATSDHVEIFSDENFDTEDFVEQMDDRHCRSEPRAGWRQLEAMREERLLRKQLDDFADWDDLGD